MSPLPKQTCSVIRDLCVDTSGDHARQSQLLHEAACFGHTEDVAWVGQAMQRDDRPTYQDDAMRDVSCLTGRDQLNNCHVQSVTCAPIRIADVFSYEMCIREACKLPCNNDRKRQHGAHQHLMHRIPTDVVLCQCDSWTRASTWWRMLRRTCGRLS